MDKCKNSLVAQLPEPFQTLLANLSFDFLEEIRFRVGQPVMLYRGLNASFLSGSGDETTNLTEAKICHRAEIGALASSLCEHSVYAHLNDIKDGFITLRGGHRAGLAGKAVMKNGQVAGLTDISGINLRIARSYVGCSDSVMPAIFKKRQVQNTLLIGPPGCGKTTLLRDIARTLSPRFKVSLVDERSEIAACFQGIPQFDVGPQTDVLDRVPKSSGMLMAVRSLSPHVLMTDELGTKADLDALRLASATGCRFIASIHGDSFDTIEQTHPGLFDLFDVALLLGRRHNRPAILSVKELTKNA